jgi:hypothetical protein
MKPHLRVPGMACTHQTRRSPDRVDLRGHLLGLRRLLMDIADAVNARAHGIDQPQGRLVHGPDHYRPLSPLRVHGHLHVGFAGDALTKAAADAQPLCDDRLQPMDIGRQITHGTARDPSIGTLKAWSSSM